MRETITKIMQKVVLKTGVHFKFTGYSKFHMIDSNGFKYDPELYLGTDNMDLLKELFQNQKVNGKMIFQVPESAKGLKLQYDFGGIIVGTKLATWII